MVEVVLNKTVAWVKYGKISLEVKWKSSMAVDSPFVKYAKCYRHKIVVTNEDTNESFEFYYYGSVYDYQLRKWRITDTELIEALRCYLEDAISVIDKDIDEFAKEFGINSIKEALRIYSECQKALNNLKLITGLDENGIIDFYNALLKWIDNHV